MASVSVFLGVGANTGDREQTIQAAAQALGRVPGIEFVAQSSLHETAPVDAPPGSPDFLNGVFELRVSLPPHALLAVCKSLEAAAGRAFDAPRNAPRPLDLDILLYGEAVVDTLGLRVPHPRMLGRSFVMAPLAELTDVSGLQPAATPRVFRSQAELATASAAWRAGGCTVGLVPTMGALHAGHASLMKLARQECDRVIATIFVNPMQFGPNEDLAAYPRTWDADLAVLRGCGVDAVYAPPADAMYPDGFCSVVAVGAEATSMEGATRPSHFSGVTTVVAKLFNAAIPHRAYFGQKDAQQVAVLLRMVNDLSYPIEMRIGGIVREPDGLALSSRNVYLQPGDREAATVLIRALRAARQRYRDGERDAQTLLRAAGDELATAPSVRVDYLELRDISSLAPLPDGPVRTGRILVAATFGPLTETADARPVRLIDNLALAGDE